MKYRSKPLINIFTLMAFIASLFGSAVFVTPAYAAGIVVNSNVDDTLANLDGNGTCDLREAITNANNDAATYTDCAAGAGADTITFTANYTITLAGSQLPTITTQMTINGKGAANTIIQANADPNTATYRVFDVDSFGNLTLDGLTVQNGRCNGSCAPFNSGGGILNRGVLTLRNSAVSGNSSSQDGGGITNNGSQMTVENSTISDNSATEMGGGILNQGPLTITDSVFSNNTVNNSGGGIFNHGNFMTVKNSTFLNNSADFGGGIYGKAASSTIVNSTFSANSANFGGGGIGSDESSNLTMTNSTLSGNSATLGSSGIHNTSSGGVVILKNTIVANSASGPNCNGAITADNFNLDSDGSCGNATQKTSAEIKLGSLANNGGSTMTFALLAGSLAIDTGDPAVCSASIGSPDYGAGGLDQRGVARPQGPGCDIGAFEANTTFADVSLNYWASSFVDRLYNAGITGGCSTSPLSYCPESEVTRAQMAVFLEKGLHYPTPFTAPNVAPTFTDTVGHWAEDWIEALKTDGITSGCATGLYCPDASVTRAQMAVFLLKAKHGSAYTPPDATGVFNDVPVGYWADKWIEQLANEGITSGCGTGIYCPDAPVTRAQMAVFLVKTFNLP